MPEHIDVVIVGAGISGVSAAWHLQDRCPTKSYAILEKRAAIGGTWDLFRYPGIRSDSDMFTLGYSLPALEEAKAIADGPAILKYLQRDRGSLRHRPAHPAPATGCWRVLVRPSIALDRARSGHRDAPAEITCRFLFLCSGYYDYEQGTRPPSPAARISRADRSIPNTGPRTSTTAGGASW